ncbi:MAG: biotin--[acetyl-CoA-carboxylase] ligase [Blautia sp.]|nr:biotin--[acetyl-CoA-carboxylase] ligase [Blautia sp.]
MTVKSKILELFEQHKGEVISGEAIAGQLGCTRAAVWKAVKSLREEGYRIEAGPNRGYTLARDTNRISAEGIRPYLDNQKAEVQVYNEVGSTNQTAKKMAIGGQAGHGSFVVARSQSEGRGRRGRKFYSPADSGLYFSIVLEPKGTLKDNLLLTTAAATAVYRAVSRLCGISLDIKWVNDLFYRGKKVCGILTEAVTDFESGEIEFAVVGIGMNLYRNSENFPEELEEIAGGLFASEKEAETVDRNQLIASVVNELLAETEDLKLSSEYVENNIIPGHTITIEDGTRTRRAFAMSICPDGRLLVKETNGKESVLSFGEVSISI